MNCSSCNHTSRAQMNASALYRFSDWYAGYHGYVSLFVCVVGVFCNLINIIVLTTPKMRNTTNMLLTALAVSDLLTMASYIPFALQFYVLYGLEPTPKRNTKPSIHFFLFHVNFTVTTHTVSIWLGVLLSIYRYAYIKLSKEKNCLHSSKNVKLGVLIVLILAVVILIPNYLSLSVSKIEGENNTFEYYELTSVSLETSSGYVLTIVNFWIHALLIKLLPCITLSIFGILLICTLRHSQRKRTELRRRSTISLTTNKKRSFRSKEHSRTTFMLLLVIILFLLTELPQGILALCSGLRKGFFEAYYIPLGDVMDIVALLNNGINFTLYCSMSKKFRNTFIRLFLPSFPHRRSTCKSSIVASNYQVSYRSTCDRNVDV